MHLNRRIKIQLVIFAVIALVAGTTMSALILNAPSRFFGIGEYTVTVKLPLAAGLYKNANVTYRGTEVGRVQAMNLTPAGVDVVLALTSDVAIPADVDAQVHSTNAVGEQYVELVPRSGKASEHERKEGEDRPVRLGHGQGPLPRVTHAT